MMRLRGAVASLLDALDRFACRLSKRHARKRAAHRLIDYALEHGQVTVQVAQSLGSSRTDIERYDGRIGTAPFRLAHVWPKGLDLPHCLGIKVFCGVRRNSGPEEAEVKAEVRDLEDSRDRLARFFLLVRERAASGR